MNTITARESGDLEEFSRDLQQFTRYSSLKEIATLQYGDGNPCSIVSSLEFDKDCEMFAVAGVTKKIKVLMFIISIWSYYNYI